MRQHLSLILDENIVSGILAIRESLGSVISNSQDQSPYLYPHITMAGYDSLSVESLLASVDSFTLNQEVVPICINAIGVFIGQTIFASPNPRISLLDLHHDLQIAIGEGEPSAKWLRPGNWTPHIGLVSPYDEQDFQQIMGSLSKNFDKILGTAIGVYVEHQESEDGSPIGIHKFLFRAYGSGRKPI